MAKWNLLNRSKTKKQEYPEGTLQKEEKQEPTKKQTKPEITKEPRELPIKEYNETLYSKDSVKKQQKTTSLEEKNQPLKRTSWENTETIEQNIDNMRRTHQEIGRPSNQMGEITDKKVDLILLKKKRKF